MLDAKDVTVRIGGAVLLDSVSLTAEAGTLTVVVGPNGAGKSTLMGVLAGETVPSGGSVTLAGRPIAAWSARDLARRRAVLPQSSNLQFHFTVAEVVGLGCAVHADVPCRRSVPEAVSRALAEADIAHLGDRPLPTLSGGEKQRAHFARCLAQLAGPGAAAEKILLLDEPTASLDPAHQHHLMFRAKRLAEEGMTVIAIVHDLNLAARYADRVAVLDRGRLVGLGPVAAVLTADLLSGVFRIPTRVLSHPVHDGPLVVQDIAG